MAKAAKSVSKISDKLAKVNESFTINMYDNGYMVDVGGRNSDDDWVSAKIIVSDEESLIAVVREAINMTRQD
jgi:hypothetical protein